MKAKLLFVLMVVGLVSICQAQAKKGYTIRGRLNGLIDGTKMFLVTERKGQENVNDTIGVSTAKNRRFEFKGHVSIEGTPCFVVIDTSRVKYDAIVRQSILLVLENRDNVTITGSVGDLNVKHGNVKVSGLEGNDFYLQYCRFDDSVVSAVNKLVARVGKEMKDSAPQVREKLRLSILKDNFQRVLQRWVDVHLGSKLSPWLVMTFYPVDSLQKIEDLYARMPVVVQNSRYGTDLIEEIRIQESISVGRLAPAFTYPDTAGCELSLKDVVSNGRFTIVDFWASWCYPCRRAFPEMKELYTRYHGKGLNILGYSVDKSPEKWRIAVREDGLPWYNIRETSIRAENLYGINAVPKTFILDHEGRIIAEGLSVEQVRSKIEELFKANGSVL